MADIRFHGRVALVRLLHWSACRVPRQVPVAPADRDELPASADLRVGPSLVPGAGLGLFTRRAYAEGEVLCAYEGVPLTTLDALRTPDWRYLVGLGRTSQGKRVWIDGRTTPSLLARYVNHHFDPAMHNVSTQPVPDELTWVMRAARPIAEGEELYCDYGRFHWHCFDRELLAEHRRRASLPGRPGDPSATTTCRA